MSLRFLHSFLNDPLTLPTIALYYFRICGTGWHLCELHTNVYDKSLCSQVLKRSSRFCAWTIEQAFLVEEVFGLFLLRHEQRAPEGQHQPSAHQVDMFSTHHTEGRPAAQSRLLLMCKHKRKSVLQAPNALLSICPTVQNRIWLVQNFESTTLDIAATLEIVKAAVAFDAFSYLRFRMQCGAPADINMDISYRHGKIRARQLRDRGHAECARHCGWRAAGQAASRSTGCAGSRSAGARASCSLYEHGRDCFQVSKAQLCFVDVVVLK